MGKPSTFASPFCVVLTSSWQLVDEEAPSVLSAAAADLGASTWHASVTWSPVVYFDLNLTSAAGAGLGAAAGAGSAGFLGAGFAGAAGAGVRGPDGGTFGACA